MDITQHNTFNARLCYGNAGNLLLRRKAVYVNPDRNEICRTNTILANEVEFSSVMSCYYSDTLASSKVLQVVPGFLKS